MLLGAAALPVAGAAVVLAEWQRLKVGPHLPVDLAPFELDGRVGGPGPALRTVWLGDSGVAGAGASTEDACIPRRVAALLDRPVDVHVLAESYKQASHVVEEQLPQVAALEPDVVVLGVGANDVLWRTPRAEFRASFDRIAAGIPDGALFVNLGALDPSTSPKFLPPLSSLLDWHRRRLDAESRAATEAVGGVVVDIAARVGPSFRRDPARMFCMDSLHASDAGYELLSHAVADVLRPLVAARDAKEATVGDR